MTLAIMQPYIFPYLGYFQLINSVDRFVFYDDVNFIKQGWVNRNRILLNGKEFLFSIPVEKISSFRSIKNTKLHKLLYSGWKKKFMLTLQQAYGRSTYYDVTYQLIEYILNVSGDENIGTLSKSSVIEICNFLGIEKDFVHTSSIFDNDNLKSKDRVIDICKSEQASAYINMADGKEIYDKKDFKRNGIGLYFLKANLPAYNQFEFPFVPGLSIIDVLMFNEREKVCAMIKNNLKYE